MTTFDVALMLLTDEGQRPVVATVSESTRVGDLVAAAGAPPQTSVARLGEPLDHLATLADAGVAAGDTLELGVAPTTSWARLGHELRVIGGIGAGRRLRVSDLPTVVGRGDDADLELRGPTLSRRHAEVQWSGDGFTVHDLGSRHGTFVDGRRLRDGEVVRLPAHAAVRVGDSVLTIASGAEPDGRSAAAPDPHVVGARRDVGARRSLTPFLVPSAGAVALTAAAGGVPTALAVAATPVALLGGVAIDKALQRRAEQRASTEHAEVVAASDAEVRGAAARLAASARAAHVDPAGLLNIAERRGGRLWSLDPATASLRVGLGAVGSAVRIEASEADRCLLADAATAHLVPATVTLRAGPVVLAGPESFLDDVFLWLVMQAVALLHPDDLELVVASDDVDRWAWTSLLPHAEAGVVVSRAIAAQGLAPSGRPRRLVVCDRARVVGLGPSDFVLSRSEKAAGHRGAGAVITSSAPARLAVHDESGVRSDVLADVLDDAGSVALSFAMRLAALGGGRRSRGGLPTRVRLPDVIPRVMAGDAIARCWRNQPDALVAVIGADVDGPVTITLDGACSHALVAGTTGAGKTRLLETLALSLAATHSPAALNIVVIDFKGGNELAGLIRLPHCVGAVSDRDSADVDRAIAALTRELARRDEVLASANATDRADYIGRTGSPMPRLLVIADEFGQFRREDAAGGRIAALLRIAAQGRSKGVHLVLATQSPSVDVTAEIRQNVGARLCLRVAETAESVAVLGTPDAAQLLEPGRVLVAEGDRARLAQVALSRGPVTLSDTARHPVVVRELVDVASGRASIGADVPAELFDAIVEAINLAATSEGHEAAVLLGPALPNTVHRSALPRANESWTANGFVLAARDRPGVPAPPPLAFDPIRDGSLTIVGGPRSGRTTALLTVAEAARAQVDPARATAVHAIDWTGGLAALAGAAGDAGVVAYRDYEHLRRTVRYLSGAGVVGLTRLVLIDRLDTLLRDLRELDAGGLATELADALQNGPRRGVYPVVSIDAAAMLGGGPQLGGVRLVLPVSEPSLAAAAGLPRRSASAPGRGVALPDGDDVQVAIPQATLPGAPAASGYVGPMPAAIAASAFSEDVHGERSLVGVGGDTALSPFVIDLDAVGPLLVVVGRSGSGRSTALRTIAATYRGQRQVVQLERGGSEDWSTAAPASLVFVDDAALAGASRSWLADPDLAEALRRGGHVLVAAFDQADLQTLGFGHWLMRRPCPGLLLALDQTPDRIVAGERVGFHPPAELRAGPPGRGWWCDRGRGTPVHVAQS